MRGNRIFRVNTNYNGSKWRWSVQVFDQTIAYGTATSQVAARKVVQTVQRKYLTEHPAVTIK